MGRQPVLHRLLALAVTVLLLLGTLAAPALAASRSFSSSSTKGFSSGSRSFSAPKVSTPSTTRSFSSPTPRASSSTTPRSLSQPKAPSYSTPSPSYSTPTSPSYSSGSRSYSSESRSYSSQRPTAPRTTGTTSTPPITYDPSTTNFPNSPPVVVYPGSPFDPTYWHDYYWGQSWWWRLLFRPAVDVSGGFGPSLYSILGGGVGVWILAGIISSLVFRRRR